MDDFYSVPLKAELLQLVFSLKLVLNFQMWESINNCALVYRFCAVLLLHCPFHTGMLKYINMRVVQYFSSWE